MNHENYQANHKNLKIDIAYIHRCVKKNLMLILMCACMTGTLSYIFFDNYLTDTYTYSVKMAIIPRDNGSWKLAENSVNSAMTRCLNVLNSATLRDRIYKSEHADKITGTLNARVVGNTNIFTMSASSSSAEGAFRLLKTALDTYPSLSQYFESGYLIKNLSSITGGGYAVSSRQAMKYSIMAALLVICASIALIGYICTITDTIHNTEQGENILDMDLLGSLPYIRKKRHQKAILTTSQELAPSYGEAIDKIVTRIREKMHGNTSKILMISSIKENDGKSTAAVNIALNLSQRGKSVILVDCDMRRPAVAKILDQEVVLEEQLSKYLEGTCSTEKLLHEIELGGQKIHCVWQTKSVSNPDKLLDGDAFKELLKILSKIADYVILDTPPLGIVRDAEIIASNADSVVMVMKQDEVRAASVNDVVDILEDTGTTVIGGILNMTKGERLAGNRYSRYGRYYYSYRKS